ncbi:hypothetical protein LINGRAHAP2_LOCUS23713 [Linum grandiflorum]
MEQPVPRTELLQGEVMMLLGLTRRREVGMRETMQQYLGRWKMRDDHVVETGLVGDPEHWHFHDQYLDWYRTFSRRWIGRRGAVHEVVVSIMFPFICRNLKHDQACMVLTHRIAVTFSSSPNPDDYKCHYSPRHAFDTYLL